MKSVGFTKMILSGVLFSTIAAADTAIFSANGDLTIPSVTVGETAFSVGLTLVPGQIPITFALGSVYGEVTSNEPSAAYVNGQLIINQVAVGDALFSAAMALVPESNPLAFELTGATELCQDCAPATLSEGGISLLSSEFGDGDAIPSAYTCSGADLSIPLTWTPGPAGTQAYAIIMDDPDAQRVAGFTFVHWNLFNLPAGSSSLQGGEADGPLPGDTINGTNDFGQAGYDGPCPPQGDGAHNYNIRIYALDSIIQAPSSPLTRGEFENSYQSHILDTSNILNGIFMR